MGKRKLRIQEIHEVGVTKSWDNAAISFKTWDNGAVSREAVISIPCPSILREIRDKLDMIEKAWRDMIQ